MWVRIVIRLSMWPYYKLVTGPVCKPAFAHKTAGIGFSTAATLCAGEMVLSNRWMGINILHEQLLAEKASRMTTDESLDTVQSSRIAQSHLQLLLLNEDTLLLALYPSS